MDIDRSQNFEILAIKLNLKDELKIKILSNYISLSR